jgi:hypothetical protein
MAKASDRSADDWTMDPDRLAMLHRRRFKHLGDEFFEEFLIECKRRGFSPWDKCLRAETYFDEDAGELRLRVALTLEGYRSAAHDTDQYAGCDDVDIKPGEGRYPSKATVTVYRLVQGQRVPFTASAFWDECAAYPLDDFWERRPKMALGYRARLAALREAFPDRFGGLWAPEEMTGTASAAAAATQQRDRRRKRGATGSEAATPIDRSLLAPQSRIQVEGEMIAMGYVESGHRDRVIDNLIYAFAELHEKDERAFWGIALASLKKDPARFGTLPPRKLGS